MTPDTLIDSTYEPCAQCGAPLDDAQRYCVFCGASRHHAADPVARYLAAARQRPAPAPPAPTAATSSARSERWLVIALALLPIAAAIGVLVGRNSAGSEDIVAALRAQKAPVVKVGGTTAGATPTATSTNTAVAATASTFPLAEGFTVELRTLPQNADAAAATKAAEAKGAPAVGVLDPAAVDVRPDPGDRLVLYSGAFPTRSKAETALAKLKHDFPHAKVVAVRRHAAAGDDSIDAPVAKHPTQAQKDEGAKIVNEIQATKGKKYVDQQRKLPDTIVVP